MLKLTSLPSVCTNLCGVELMLLFSQGESSDWSKNLHGPQLLPDGNDSLYPGCHVKKNDLLLMLVAFVLRFKLCAAACQALLALLDIILPGCIPSSNYYVEKIFGFDNRNVDVHYFCNNADCMEYFGLTVPVKCKRCDTVYNESKALCQNSFMLVLPIGEQLKCILDQTLNWKEIFRQREHNSGLLHDVVDGKQYSRVRGCADVTLQFNCDGAPIFNSSKFSIWPLVCAINELPTALRSCNMILNTLWFGRVKPCVTTFLQPFISEINDLYRNGLNVISPVTGEARLLFVNATLCICDAPARAMLQAFTQFNGQFGCGFCYHSGERIQKGSGSVQVYPLNSLYPPRTHRETLKLAEKAVLCEKPVQGVKGPSILALLPNFDIVRCFVPDYMHCVLLGVVRQFVNLWTDSSSHDQPYYIRNIKILDNLLKSIKPPDEVHRLPRTLSDRKYWKASEYKNLLLLYSPVVLKSVLPKRYYVHWLLLCNGVRLLLLDAISDTIIQTSRHCLNKFVALTPDLYGLMHVSYNVHLLSHLPDSVHNWGPLWSHSAFVYEDVLGFLKKEYHGTQLVPRQLFKYFTAWNKLRQYSYLLLESEDSVLRLYKQLISSVRWIYGAVRIGEDFVGLRKSAVTAATESHCALIYTLLSYDASMSLRLQSYDRFVFRAKVFATSKYCDRYRRNNSFVLLTNGCFANINFCFIVRTCVCCTDECSCHKDIVLLVTCCLSGRLRKHIDSYAGIDLTQFVRRVINTNHDMIAITPNDISEKYVTIACGNDCYAVQLPHFEIA